MPNTATFRKQLEGFSTGVLITHGLKTLFHARPMLIAHVDENCDLWFLAKDKTPKVIEIEADSRVQVICQDDWTLCACISGQATIIRNSATIQKLWKSNYKSWFPAEDNFSQIVLIHVRGEMGEYWNTKGLDRLSYAYESLTVREKINTAPAAVEQHGLLNFAAAK